MRQVPITLVPDGAPKLTDETVRVVAQIAKRLLDQQLSDAADGHEMDLDASDE
jgi:hypothetical protein